MGPNENNKARKVRLKNFQDMVNKIPLETQVRIGIAMADYDKWFDGEYTGDDELIDRQVKSVINTIEKWKENNFINPIRK